MPVTADWVHYDRNLGYLARPERAGSDLPAVVVIQEVWGVDEHIQDVARRLAAAGYAALAPDLYASGGERPPAMAADRVAELKAFASSLPAAAWTTFTARQAEIAKLPSPVRERIGETYHALFDGIGQLGRLLPPLRSSVNYVRTACPWSRGQKAACVGFCMGGGLSALLACEEPELAGAAVFYGSSPPADLVPKIGCPVIGFYGARDPRIMAGVPAFAQAMQAAGKSFTHFVYEAAGHAFFNDTRPSYDVRAARDAFARLLEFLQRTTSP